MGFLCWRFSNRVLLILSLLIFVVPTTVLALLNYSDEQPLWSFSTPGEANSVALSSDGSYVALGVATDVRSGQVFLFNKGGSQLWSHDTNSGINSVSITPDGSLVVAAGYRLVSTDNPPTVYENASVYCFDRSGTQLWNYTTTAKGLPGEFGDSPLQVHVSPDGSRIAVDNGTGPIVLNGQGRLLWSHSVGTGFPLTMTLTSANVSLIATVSNRVHAFNSNGESLWNSTVSPYSSGAIMSNDGKYLAVAGESRNPSLLNSTLFLFDGSGSLVWARALTGETDTLVISADDNVLVFQGGGTASFNLQDTQLWNYTNGEVNSLAVTSDGSYVVAGMRDQGQQTMRLLDSHGRLVWGSGTYGWVHQIAISSDESYTAIAYGPYTSAYGNSAVVQFYPGPKTLASERGPLHSILYFAYDTYPLPVILVVPTILAIVPLAYLAGRAMREARAKGLTAESSPAPTSGTQAY